MAEQRPGILRIYREIIHDPLTAYQRKVLARITSIDRAAYGAY